MSRLLLAILVAVVLALTVTGCAAVPAPAAPAITVTAATSGPSAALAQLAVKGRAPATGYSRAQFGPGWVDVDRDGCDQRNDVLARDLTDVTFKPGTHDCVVTTGTLVDPYTGRTIEFVRGARTSSAVQIDHVVSLSDAWQTGAQQLDAATRVQLANDLGNLLAVDGPTNESKGDGDAATWLPPARGFWCSYASRQVEIKARYRLWVTPAEHDALARALAGCPALSPAGLAVASGYGGAS